LPDWQFVESSEDTPGLLDFPYIKHALSRGEWAKASDCARLYALHKYGGVYLDSDIELVKSLNPLLTNKFFAGWEDDEYICNAVMGTSVGGTIISRLWNEFPKAEDFLGKANVWGPVHLTNTAKGAADATIYTREYFYPKHWSRYVQDAEPSDNTYAIHHWQKSWVKE